MEQVGKPTIETVLKYAEKSVDIAIVKRALHLPAEHKDEIRQNAMLRVLEAYRALDAERGWKTFIQQHCEGAVMDYLREGQGFKESKKQKAADEEPDADPASDIEEGEDAEPAPESPSRPRRAHLSLSTRVSICSESDGHALDVEEIAGIYGVFTDPEEPVPTIRPRWELVARMASIDREMLLVAQILRGFTQQELAEGFGVTREMLSQRIRAFFEKLDDPQHYHSPWVKQSIYALGLCDYYGMDPVDQGVGWNNDPVDLDNPETAEPMNRVQLRLFPR